MQYYTGNTTTTTAAAAAAAAAATATDASMVTVAPIPSLSSALSSGAPPSPLSSSLSPSPPSYSIEPINYVSAVDDEMFLVDHFEGER